LASITFCAIIATGYSQDSEFPGWACGERKKEINRGSPWDSLAGEIIERAICCPPDNELMTIEVFGT
jgi:hypothetical protein